jgi:hypothetical protein
MTDRGERVIAASIVQVFYIRKLVFDEKYLNNVWQVVLSTEIVQTTSIMTACIPFLKPFLMSLESGFLRADNVDRATELRSQASSQKIISNASSRYIRLADHQRDGDSVGLGESVTGTSHGP